MFATSVVEARRIEVKTINPVRNDWVFHCERYQTVLYFELSYLLTNGITNRHPNSEGTSQMIKSLIASIAYIALAAGLSTAPVKQLNKRALLSKKQPLLSTPHQWRRKVSVSM